MALEDDLRERRMRISQATARKARAQAEYDANQARSEQASKTLSDDFGVTDRAGAAAKLTELKADLDAKEADIETKLKEAGV